MDMRSFHLNFEVI
ncbi:hypothetical protein CGLO_18211 [Colletotrichum gloeosporioides Cg-14]|uniref:Uncharacterized protein n=2 Tax=cellular organisms TaxID=131567 RepID=T0L4K6_COLGC|nr:hypothetical protein CGLO_18211 [Colletotrichum gloeosporioides Cg-14]